MTRSKLRLVAWLLVGSWLLPAAPAQAIITITVVATYGIVGPSHVAVAGTWIITEAGLTVDGAAYLDRLAGQKYTYAVPVDVYVGLIQPDGRFASWVGDPRAPSLLIGPAPVPLLAGVVPSDVSSSQRVHQFGASDARGWYVLYGLVVDAGADPLDPHRWITTSFFPLLVTPPVTQ